jgi:lysophospholipase L1-like esterase
MKVKHSIFLFFTGILIGTILQSITKTSFEKILVSPISQSFAYKGEILSPLAEKKVQEVKILGKKVKSSPVIKKKADKALNVPIPRSSPSYLPSSSPIPDPSPFPRLSPSSSPVLSSSPSLRANFAKLKSSNYKGWIRIAVYGDSMTDLMGTNLPYLKKELKKYYPEAKLELLNYGIGAENIEKGLERLTQNYNYKDRNYPSLIQKNPDIIIIDPFVYNPFSESEGEINRYWSNLTKLTDKLKRNTNSQLMILATIAPSRKEFGNGPNGVNWDADTAWKHAERIKKYMESAINYAGAAKIPLIDVYHQTLLANGEGSLKYINSGDHIHQNVEGNELIAKQIAEKIKDLELY